MGRALQAIMLKHFRADLHIHTALSPCGADEMTPDAIVTAALAKGLDMIAVCDHNATGNVAAVREAAGDRLSVLAGIEICTAEEVHVLGLFPDMKRAEEASVMIRSTLPPADAGYYAFFGEQWVLDSGGAHIGRETAALALASRFSLPQAVELVHRGDGLAVACHIDRKSFSIFSQLGFFPEDAGFDALEVSRHFRSDSPQSEEFDAIGLPLTASSDSHYLEEIGSTATDVLCVEPTFAELALAFRGVDGRRTARA